MTLRPDVVYALATRQRQIDRLLAEQAQEVFHVGELVVARESLAGLIDGREYRVTATRGRWLRVNDADTGRLLGTGRGANTPSIGPSYFRLADPDACVFHAPQWRTPHEPPQHTNGDTVGWYECGRCDAVLPEKPSGYWMTHDNSKIPLPNPATTEAHDAHTERTARPRAAA